MAWRECCGGLTHIAVRAPRPVICVGRPRLSRQLHITCCGRGGGGEVVHAAIMVLISLYYVGHAVYLHKHATHFYYYTHIMESVPSVCAMYVCIVIRCDFMVLC